MANSTKYLFLFTIGPVQSFIAQARKTQDLYAGSQILSELIKEAIKIVERKNVIFPYAYPDEDNKWQDVKSLPNRFIATVDLPVEDLKNFGETIEKAVRSKWFEISQRPIVKLLCQKANDNKSIKFDIAGINQQLEQHLDIFWLFEPLEKYQKSFKRIEQNLGAIKNFRPFKQFNYNGIGERGRKCSLDGEMNAYFFGNGTKPNYFKEKWNPFAILLDETDNIKVAKNEGLSAISFAKRFYKKEKFDSTSDICLLNAIARLPSIEHEQFKNLLTVRRKGKEIIPFDEQCYFEENLSIDALTKNFGVDNVKPILENWQTIQTIYRKHIKPIVKEYGFKYYALLSFDGDNMGKWLSGENTPNIDLQNFHSKLSEHLGIFAEEATNIVNKNGRTVYAGGDDFLGFVNLEYLFETLKLLRENFDIIVNNELKKVFPTLEKKLTFSAGVTIAHYKTPLNIVINKTKAAEHAAKDSNDKKNAIAFNFLTHSGNNHLAAMPWGENLKNLENMKTIFLNLQEDFSDKWIRSFCETFYLFPETTENGEKKEIDEEFRPLIKVELKRLITRAYKGKLTSDEKKTKSEALTNAVLELLSATDYHYDNFTELLNITNALASKIN